MVDRLPLGEVTIIDGKGGIGKTTMTIDVAARLSCGSVMPDGTPAQPSMALIIAEEDRQSIIKARLLAAGADLSRVRLVASVGESEALFLLPNHAPALLQTVRETAAGLVIIDSLFSHFDDEINAHRAQDVRRALRPLVEIAHETGTAIVGIRHWTKGAAAASDRGQGNIDIRNICRCALTVAEHPDEEGSFVVAVSKSNLGRACQALTYRLESITVTEENKCVDVARVAWGEPVAISADELSNRIVPLTEDASDRDAAADWLCDYLSEPKQTQALLQDGKAAGYSRATLYRAAKRLGIAQHRRGFGNGSTWEPPARASFVSQSSQSSPVRKHDTNSMNAETNRDHDLRDEALPL